ncbi:MAG: hypothetical protein R2991_10775, partial [Thermoanaerobaculia bacterium]
MREQRVSLRWVLVAGALLFPALAGSAARGQEREYTVVLGGNVAGTQTVRVADDGTVDVRYAFNDRGRGPDVEASYRFDASGLPVAVVIDGVEYMKGEVGERFSIEDGRAVWTNRGEEGSSALERPAFYVAFDGVPSETAWLAAAALRAPEGRLALLPAGETAAEVVERRTLSGADGEALEARYVELSGLSFSPTGVWIDSEGHLAAQVSSWFSVVRKGFEGEVADLLAFQDARSGARLQALAGELAHRPGGDL